MSIKSFTHCTIYYRSELMGTISSMECRSVEIEIRKYAQYENAVHVKFIKKGARKPRGFVQTHKPSLIVVEGHKNIKPLGMFEGGKQVVSEDMTTTEAKHTAFSDGYADDFDQMLEEWLAKSGRVMLADYRG